MGSNSIPPKTPSDESINRGLVCAHMHFIARTRRILTFMSWTGECRQQEHTQQAPSMRTECDYLSGWIEKRSYTQKSHPKVVNPRDTAGERKKNQKKNQNNWVLRVKLLLSWFSTSKSPNNRVILFKEVRWQIQQRLLIKILGRGWGACLQRCC